MNVGNRRHQVISGKFVFCINTHTHCRLLCNSQFIAR